MQQKDKGLPVESLGSYADFIFAFTRLAQQKKYTKEAGEGRRCLSFNFPA